MVFQNWFDNDFEIESKYHHKICCLVVLAHILSSQDVIFLSMFFLIADTCQLREC